MTAPRPFPAHNAVARSLLNSLKLAALAACIAPPLAVIAQPVQSVAPAPYPALVQPPNVGEAKIAATAYHDSGAYARDLASVASDASGRIAERARQVSRPALVLDIDDTALTNWEVIKASNRGACY